MQEHRLYQMSFAQLYPLYVNKAVRKGRTKNEVDEIIAWLTGNTTEELERILTKDVSLKDFFANAPKMNPLRNTIRGVVCGVRVETIKDPLMREIRSLDKLIDELADGTPLHTILAARR